MEQTDINRNTIMEKRATYYKKKNAEIDNNDIKRFENYTLDLYIEDVTKNGLEITWDLICAYIMLKGENSSFLTIDNFGEMYEIGLAIQDKLQKKKSGQYYTPEDVALLMAKWFDKCEGDNICDVACGTGKLVLTYLDLIGFEKATKIINDGKIYLYDFDQVALKICKTAIAIKYKITDLSCIHDVYCDFLDKDVVLPSNSKVISNPPYAAIDNIEDYWEHSAVINKTKELYSAFMEKIFLQAKATVIITPFSFVSSNKFYLLRKEMCELGNGFIVSFDNVPGNIFCGRKHGIFNTNTANSVRAAITVLHQNEDLKGFRVSPLVRFKNEERKELLLPEILEKVLPENLQIVNSENKTFAKVDRRLESIFDSWKKKSDYVLKDLLLNTATSQIIDMPNTCRYYTTASHRKLSRNGSIVLNVEDKDTFNFIYCWINSSFAYWWWRVFDGGITYPLGLLLSMPMPLNLLTDDDKCFFEEMCSKLITNEDKYVITKMNAGVAQENIKFPEEFRDEINARILSILGYQTSPRAFDCVHANYFFIKNNVIK